MTAKSTRTRSDVREAVLALPQAPAQEVASQLDITLRAVEAIRTDDRRRGVAADLMAEALACRGRETLGEIAKRLGLTRNQVASFHHRSESLLKRPDVRAAYDRLVAALGPMENRVDDAASPSTRSDARRKAPPAPPARAPAPSEPVTAQPSGLPQRLASSGAAASPPMLNGAAHAVAGLTSTTCRWPLGDPSDPSFAFCCQPAPVEKPYCPACARLAYTGLAPKVMPRAFIGATSRRAA